jgi:hypothetical protein
MRQESSNLDHEDMVLRREDLLRRHFLICSREHPVKHMEPEAIAHFQDLLSQVKYKNWEFTLVFFDDMLIFQVLGRVNDVSTGNPIANYGPPYPLCPNMDDEFFIDFVFRAILEQEMHEAAEYFIFKNIRVYYPHDSSGQPLDKVWSLQARKNKRERSVPVSSTNSMNMKSRSLLEDVN